MSQMKQLTERYFQEKLSKVFARVFESNDPFNNPFNPGIHHRAILYPVAYQLEMTELQAIAIAAQAVGDDGFYFSVMERSDELEHVYPWHWYISLNSLEDYYTLSHPFVLENALYSPEGKWGIMISHEQHAVIGGSNLFLDTLIYHFPGSPEEHLEAFLDTWKANHLRVGTNIDWISNLLTHIYGVREAKRLLSQFGLEN